MAELRGIPAQIRRKRACRQADGIDELELIATYLKRYQAQDPYVTEAQDLRAELREHFEELGGEGTPSISQFVLLELGTATGLDEWHLRQAGAAALDLQYRLPHVLAACHRAEVEIWVAQRVCELTRDLPWIECCGLISDWHSASMASPRHAS